MSGKGSIVILSGPSGVGKSTICKELIKAFGDKIYLSISATSRERKNGERHGEDYYFLDRNEFSRQIKAGNFLEYAEVFGNLYGTPKDKVEAALKDGKIVLLEIDVQGAEQIKKIYPNAISIFIMPPEHRELKNRIVSRGRDTDEDIAKRLAGSCVEMAAGWQQYDYIVVNDKLDLAVKEIIKIIENVQRTVQNA